MGYKLSKYNRYVEMDNGMIFVHNLLSLSQSILNNEEYKNLLEIQLGDDLDEYIQLGFVIDDKVDEEAYLELERKLAMYSSLKEDFGVVIAPTMDCNARCFYCYELDTRSKFYMNEETEKQLIEYIINSLNGKKKLWISWFGGEPLLCAGLMDRVSKKLITYCNDNDVEYDSEITTNGYLAGEYLDIVKSSKINEVQITIDGYNEEYEKRKKYYDVVIDPWGTVVNNVFLLSEFTHVTLRLNFDKNNLDSLKKAVEYLYLDERWNDNVSLYYYPLEPVNCYQENQFYSESEYEAAYNDLYTHLYELGYYNDRPKGLDFRTMSMPCYCASLSMNAIDYKGDIFQCQHLLCRDKYKIGDIWKGIIVNKEFISWFDGTTPEQCKGCSVMPLCQCGCITKRNLGENHFLCHIMKYRVACQEKLKAKELLKSLELE